MNITILILFALLCIINPFNASTPSIPVIGIYTQDYDGDHSYIASSYVKYIQMSGAHVVPLFYTSTQEQLMQTLSHINGVLIPGGDQNINIQNRLTQNANRILQYSISEFEQGRIFPIWGTCAGHGLLGYLTSKFNPNTRQPIQNARGIMNTLILKTNDSKVLSNVNQQILKITSEAPGILYYFQRWAIYQQTYEQDENLNTFWNVVATSLSSAGKQYISIMQGKKYPVFTVQFHPEKNNFEWQIQTNKTAASIQISQVLSNNFIQYAKKNENRYPSQQQMYKNVIQNYESVVPTSEDYNMFTQIYIFDQKFIQIDKRENIFNKSQ